MNVGLNSKEITYSGRIDTTQPSKPEFVYPASFLQFSFFGKKATIIVKNSRACWNNSVGAIINGEQFKYPLNSEGITIIDLVNSDVEQEFEIMFFKRMDSCHTIKIENLELSEGSRLLPKKELPLRKIEVYGDSVSAGEVSEAVEYVGKPDPENHEGEFSNSWYSYPWIFARKVNAQLHNIAQGGIPLMTGTGWVSPPTYIGMEEVWDKVHYHPELKKKTSWDFRKYTPDLVIIAIGQNCSNPVDFMKENPNAAKAIEWKTKYKELVLDIRSKYPKAVILLTTTILMHHVNWDKAIEEVYQELKEDVRIRHFIYSHNGRGTPGHIRISEAEEMANELVDYIENIDIPIWEV